MQPFAPRSIPRLVFSVSLLTLLLGLPTLGDPAVAQELRVVDQLRGPVEAPSFLAVSSDGELVYGAGYRATQLWSRDPATGALRFLDALLPSADLQFSFGVDFALSSGDESLYVLRDVGDGTLSVYRADRSAGALETVQDLSFGGDVRPNAQVPRRLALSPDGRHLYVAGTRLIHYDRNPVRGTLTFRGELGVPSTEGLVVTGDGSWVVHAARGAYRLFRRSATSGALTPAAEVADPAIVSRGRLARAATRDDRILAVTREGEFPQSSVGLVIFRIEDDGTMTREGRLGLAGFDVVLDAFSIDPESGWIAASLFETNSFQAFVEVYQPIDDGTDYERVDSRGSADGAGPEPGAAGLVFGPGREQLYVGSFARRTLATVPFGGSPPELGEPLEVTEISPPVDLALPAGGPLLVASEQGFAGVSSASRDLGLTSWTPNPFQFWQSLDATPDGRFVFAGAEPGPSSTFAGGPDGYEPVARRPEAPAQTVFADGTLLASWGFFQDLRVGSIDPASGEVDWWGEGGLDVGGDVLSLTATPDGTRLYAVVQDSSTFEGRVVQLDAATRTLELLPREAVFSSLRAFAWSPDGSELYAARVELGAGIVSLQVLEWTGSEHVERQSVNFAVLSEPATRQELTVDPSGRWILVFDGDDALHLFDRRPGTGLLERVQVLRHGVDGVDWLRPTGASPRDTVSLAAGDDAFYVGSRLLGTVTELRLDCAALALCLQDGRFQVEVAWRLDGGEEGFGVPVPGGTADSGLFWFFGEENWELLVKVLDGCGVNDRVWVFAAATTDVGYTLRVTDTLTGERAEYENPVGVASPAVVDTDALSTSCAAGQPIGSPAPRVEADLKGGDEVLRLDGERFEARITWRDFEGLEGVGRVAAPRTSDSGLFWFFGPANYEVLLKVLDGCAINGHYWVLAAATTNVAYTLDIVDTDDGEIFRAENPLGVASPAVIDIEAFDCS